MPVGACANAAWVAPPNGADPTATDEGPHVGADGEGPAGLLRIDEVHPGSFRWKVVHVFGGPPPPDGARNRSGSGSAIESSWADS